jgi:hypothetical protein
MSRSVEHQLRQCFQSFRFVLREQSVTSHDDSVQIRNSAAFTIRLIGERSSLMLIKSDGRYQERQRCAPGAKMESPSSNPMISRIFFITKCSIMMKTGAISYVNLWSIWYNSKLIQVRLHVFSLDINHLRKNAREGDVHVSVGSRSKPFACH